MNNFETVIGIEIHIELNTKSKMFSSGPNDFKSDPNTNLTPVDVAYPGTLPVVNKEAVMKAALLGKALGMKIDHELHFDRKHYFYPDLPKGFQITQQFRPIGANGSLPIANKAIKIERIHLEEDTARSYHHDAKYTLLNYNRAGIPLIEIVTEPVIKNKEEAVQYVDGIRKLVKRLDISDAKMEEGSLRADVNISLRPYGQKEFGTKVEIKNINSLSNIATAIEREEIKQAKDLMAGTLIAQTTKRFNEQSNDTETMRVKTGVADYKYFPDPNIPPIKLPKEANNITLPELPWETKARLESYKIDQEFINQIMSDDDKLNFVDGVPFADKTQVTKLLFAELIPAANKQNISISELKIDFADVNQLLLKSNTGEISGSHVKRIIPLLLKGDMGVEDIIKKHGFKQISDERTLKQMIQEIIDSNLEFISTNKDRSERVTKFILGQLMKQSKGQANPVIANKLVKMLLRSHIV